MSIFNGLKPELVWTYFEEICKIPRLSKDEGRIRAYLMQFARQNNLCAKEDSAGNILIVKEASPGMEDRKTVVLQSHMDMVGEKNADHPHDWAKDPIIPVVKDGWVTASGTTLGADDGIGIAAQMAILADKNIATGKLECLFTTDEESGMTGAINLSPDFFEGRILINLDSEDEGILFIGCAGGMDTVAEMTYTVDAPDYDGEALEISVTGLRGGHSGDEIHKGFGNSVKIMNRILWNLSNEFIIALASFDGGNLRNAIPREAFATIVVNRNLKENVKKRVEELNDLIKDELGHIEKELNISVKDVSMPDRVMDKDNHSKLLAAINCCPHGPLAWSTEMEDLVETSTNLASVKFVDNNRIRIVTTQRSSIESSKIDAGSMVASCMKLAGARVEHSAGYPGWRPNISSEILKITIEAYRTLFSKEPQVRAIHAGLECGLIYEKNKGIDMISFGPTIRGAHTPEERLEIKTALMFWDLLLEVLARIPKK
ncbi:MAG: aminoacyl-histidine dipeptidase [Bacteroidales bacterium]|nr:aminoacyl-histidine dipeptidase [Bacteroidales bacterium]MBN2632601.1 aminoacyl-histidine dipeptidase [Bacteroidales bacterium]